MINTESHTPTITELALMANIGLLSSIDALKAAGMSKELAAQITLQCHGKEDLMILRAGGHPINDHKMSPKSGANLSKTSNHGLLKGVIAVDVDLTKTDENGQAIGHHPKDAANLKKKSTDVDYQHRIPHTVTFDKILDQLDIDGDLEVTAYDEDSEQLILSYRAGHGPSQFTGCYVLQLTKGKREVRSFDRPWESPKTHRKFSNETQVIERPKALASIPEKFYNEIFHQRFTLYRSDLPLGGDQTSFTAEQIRPVHVFADKSRSLSEFLKHVPKKHPRFRKLSGSGDLGEALSHLSEKEASNLYLKSPQSLAITGDWDIMSIAYKNDLDKRYRQVFNTFDKSNDCEQKMLLIQASNQYLRDLIGATQKKRERMNQKLSSNNNISLEEEEEKWTQFDAFINQLFLENIKDLIRLHQEKRKHLAQELSNHDDISRVEDMPEWTQFDAFINQLLLTHITIEELLKNITVDEWLDHIMIETMVPDKYIERAGCITAHEFIFEQLINYAHSCKKNKFYGEVKYYHGLQQALDEGLSDLALLLKDGALPPDEEILARGKKMTKAYCKIQKKEYGAKPNSAIVKNIEDHLSRHLLLASKELAQKEKKKAYIIPHLQFDHNVRYPFQHGVDMRNPYGSNLNGAWLMFTPEGGILFGKTEKQLIQVLLMGNFLRDNIIDINHGAKMELWHEVIEKQIELGQAEVIPFETLEKYIHYQHKTDNQSKIPLEILHGYLEQLSQINEHSRDVIKKQIELGQVEIIPFTALEKYIHYQFETDNQSKVPLNILYYYLKKSPALNEKSTEIQWTLDLCITPWIKAEKSQNMSIWYDFIKQQIKYQLSTIPHQRLASYLCHALNNDLPIDDKVLKTYISKKSDLGETSPVPEQLMMAYRNLIGDSCDKLHLNINRALLLNREAEITLDMLENYMNYQFNLGKEGSVDESILTLYVNKRSASVNPPASHISEKIVQYHKKIASANAEKLKQEIKSLMDDSMPSQIPLSTLEKYIHYQSILKTEDTIDTNILAIYVEKKKAKSGLGSIAKNIIELIEAEHEDLESDIQLWLDSTTEQTVDTTKKEQLAFPSQEPPPSIEDLEKYFSYALLLDKDESIDNAVLDFYINRKSELNETDAIPVSILQLHQQRTERQFKI